MKYQLDEFLGAMVSVIVPVYNTGNYLRTCVESILRQSYSDLEILIVDDGSVQETAEICDTIATSDPRIRVIHKRNEGVSVARNVGLDNAHGDILFFVDSDDTIEPLMIESMVEAMEQQNCEVVICDSVTLSGSSLPLPDTFEIFQESVLLTKEHISTDSLLVMAGSVWRCAYRKSLLDKNDIRFPKGIKFSEDRIFNIAALGCATQIAYLKKPFYKRLIRQGSACFRFYPDMTEQIVAMRNVLISTVLRFWGKEYLNAYEGQISGQIYVAITNYSAPGNGLSFKEQYRKISELCDNESIRESLINSGFKDIRTKLILERSFMLLLFLGRIVNRYHKICHKGQYQG